MEMTKGKNIALWIVQGLLAAGFLMAGISKFFMPPEVLTQGAPFLSVGFIYFIGAAEAIGALGLILPQATGIKQFLTPLAAALLGVIMIGATVIAAMMGIATAIFPFVFLVLCVVVAVGRK